MRIHPFLREDASYFEKGYVLDKKGLGAKKTIHVRVLPNLRVILLHSVILLISDMIKKNLTNYFEGKATPEEEAQIMDWAEASPENYRQYLNERKLWDALLINALSNKTNTETRKGKSIKLWKAIGIAASFSLFLSLTWILLKNNEESLVAGVQTITVPAGQRVHLFLEDSTSVWLNSKTTLSYPSSFGKGSRVVTLNGEAYFDVAKKGDNPFIVKTSKYDITVTGTSFNVYAYKENEELFETSLLSGKVSINNINDSSQEVWLKPHQRAMETDGKLETKTINNPDHFRWKEGLICLDDVPFEDLMKKFSIYYDIPIRIENETVLSYHCTGKFRQSDGIEYALRVLQKDLKFNFERKGTENSQIIFIR